MDFTEAEPRIRKIAWEWADTIQNDPAVDFEDLLQELRWRYWKHWNETGEHPDWNLMRDWTRLIMRKWGYIWRGRNAANPNFYCKEPNVVLAGDCDAEIDEEEFLDQRAFRRSSRYAWSKTNNSAENDGWEE